MSTHSQHIHTFFPEISEKYRLEILKDLKIRIIDIWREENVVNLSIPLSIKVKFRHNLLYHFSGIRSGIQISHNKSLLATFT